ncbi:hypothetical protein ACQKFG_21175 [Peribacillus sp. NPDC076916]|uniref:hypothetical protein n=1 Tax=Peribacillus sp. NPDC076916 TaxID=3390608 RepID=UPI003CFFC550
MKGQLHSKREGRRGGLFYCCSMYRVILIDLELEAVWYKIVAIGIILYFRIIDYTGGHSTMWLDICEDFSVLTPIEHLKLFNAIKEDLFPEQEKDEILLSSWTRC